MVKNILRRLKYRRSYKYAKRKYFHGDPFPMVNWVKRNKRGGHTFCDRFGSFHRFL